MVTTKVAAGGPDPVDVAVGARIRMVRKSRDISQSRLAEAIGLTFQQIQKYERGTNRVSASVLVRIAGALGCRASELLGEGETAAPSRFVAPLSMLSVSGAQTLLEAYTALPHGFQRKAILVVIQAMAFMPETGTADGD